MLASIKDFFINRLDSNLETGPEKRETRIKIATAALMFEIGLSDSHIQEEERLQIEQAMRKTFNLNEEETRELIMIAENEIDNAVSLYEFTRLLNERLSRGERNRIIEMLWQVACADNVLDKYEEYYIRKIADLLYITHADYIRAKHRAAGQSG